MIAGNYNFENSNSLKESVKFNITHLTSKFNENDRTWSIDLPEFFYNNAVDYRQISISTFIYFRPNGTSDVGTTFHSADLYDLEYNQPELDYFCGMSGTTISGVYTLNSRKRALTFWFKDYKNMNERYGKTEFYNNPETGEDVEGNVSFFIQAELIY